MSHLQTFCNEATYEQVNSHRCSVFFKVNNITHDDPKDSKTDENGMTLSKKVKFMTCSSYTNKS